MELLISVLIGLIVLMILIYIIRLVATALNAPAPFINIATAILCLVFLLWIVRHMGAIDL